MIKFWLSSLRVIPLLLLAPLALSQSVTLSVQTGHSSAIRSLQFSHDGKRLATSGSDSRIVIWDIVTGKQYQSMIGHQAQVNDVSFHPDGMRLASASDDGKVIVWDLATAEALKTFEFPGKVRSVWFSPDGKKLAVAAGRMFLVDMDSGTPADLQQPDGEYRAVTISDNGELIAFGNQKRVKVLKLSDKSLTNKFSLKTNRLAFSRDGQYLTGAGANGKLKKWSLAPGRPKTQTVTAERVWQSYLWTSISDKYFAGGNRNKLISVYDLTSGRKVKVLNGHSGDVAAISFSPDGKILASAGVDKNIVLWDTQDWEVIKTLKATTEKVNDIEFSDDGKSLVVGYGNGGFRYWQTEPGGEMIFNSVKASRWEQFRRWGYTITDVTRIEGRTVSLEGFRVKRSKRHDRFGRAIRYMYTWNLDDNTYSTRKRTLRSKQDRSIGYYEKVKEITLLKPANFTSEIKGQLEVSKSSATSLSVKDIRTQKVTTIATDHTDEITSVKVNPQKGFVATASWDGLIKLWDLKDGTLMMNLLASNDYDYIFITPENNYFSSKGALEHIGFKVGAQIFSFNQFDLHFNRPDLVLEGLNHPDTLLISAYRLAHLKRIEKSGVKSLSDVSKAEIPEVGIALKNKTINSSQKHVELVIDAKATGSLINKLSITVNGVPLDGTDVTGDKATLHQEVKIELSQGMNLIRCYVTNTEGAASLEQLLQITYRGERMKPDLYLVAIGASSYNSKEFDLRYAAKDAKDIETLFRGSNRFKEVKTLTILNEQVNRESVTKINQFLNTARVDDMVLITYSGHGLFDRNLEYFLSTYDIDFDNPENRGLAYSEIEKILEQSSSRNKVLLVDACHSGEIDKSEVELESSATRVEEGEIRFRNVGPNIRNKSGNVKSSFELSKALFADEETSHGAVVISSASGGEYAIEGNEWRNGVFTHCFIKGLKYMKSDLNKDGHVTIAELQRYLGKEVFKMTNGQQTPTSRDENLTNNFIIW